jgi:hypothetical protein
MSGGIDPLFAKEFANKRGHDGLTQKELMDKLRANLAIIDLRDAEVTRLRDVLGAAESFVADELENRERSFLTPSGGISPTDDGEFKDYVLPAREVLSTIRAALGK